MMELIDGVRLVETKSDVGRWKLEFFLVFSCKSFQLLVHKQIHGRDCQRRRPNCCLSPHWCIMCRLQGEKSNHVFVHCALCSGIKLMTQIVKGGWGELGVSSRMLCSVK